MVVVVGGDLVEVTVIGRQVLHVHRLERIGHRIDSQRVSSMTLMTGTSSTHHLEGVGEGKSMVLGVGLMLSLFVFDR